MASKTINVSISDQVVKELDRIAKRESRTRSSLLRDAILEYMQKHISWEDLQADASEQAQKMGISTEEDVQRLVDEVRESLAEKYRA